MLHDLIYNPIYEDVRKICSIEYLLYKYQELYNILVYNVGFSKTKRYLLEHYSVYEKLHLLKFSWSLAFKKLLNKIKPNYNY